MMCAKRLTKQQRDRQHEQYEALLKAPRDYAQRKQTHWLMDLGAGLLWLIATALVWLAFIAAVVYFGPNQ